jgi:ribosomal-protein-alanine N-acetyltransferase
MLTITQGYKQEDVDRLYELEKISFSRAFRWRKEDLIAALKTNEIWVGVYDNKIAGYVLMETEGDSGHIVSLTVDPEFRRKGFGKALMDVAEAHYKKEGYKRIVLEVHPDNAAQTLYFKLGYRVTGIRHNYYSNGSAGITMEKPLKK